MKCSRCQGQDPNCDVCYEEPIPDTRDYYEEAKDELLMRDYDDVKTAD